MEFSNVSPAKSTAKPKIATEQSHKHRISQWFNTKFLATYTKALRDLGQVHDNDAEKEQQATLQELSETQEQLKQVKHYIKTQQDNSNISTESLFASIDAANTTLLAATQCMYCTIVTFV